MGVPKTIDNDLFGTDHCPGYASAAKYIATSLMEVNLDAASVSSRASAFFMCFLFHVFFLHMFIV